MKTKYLYSTHFQAWVQCFLKDAVIFIPAVTFNLWICNSLDFQHQLMEMKK